ncbi:hypothetical protein RND81_05G138700 [Saponaria officinalis]|uniref:Uncharacterized protein n=1 Tax=Saponaria officinalis TaxID=3572 RepID=A0AAW1KWF0_SAPOF
MDTYNASQKFNIFEIYRQYYGFCMLDAAAAHLLLSCKRSDYRYYVIVVGGCQTVAVKLLLLMRLLYVTYYIIIWYDFKLETVEVTDVLANVPDVFMVLIEGKYVISPCKIRHLQKGVCLTFEHLIIVDMY